MELMLEGATDRRVGEESREQPWLRGMRLRLCPSPPAPARTLWGPELMVLRAVVVSTRPGEPLRLPGCDWETILVRLRPRESTWLDMLLAADSGCLVRTRPREE